MKKQENETRLHYWYWDDQCSFDEYIDRESSHFSAGPVSIKSWRSIIRIKESGKGKNITRILSLVANLILWKSVPFGLWVNLKKKLPKKRDKIKISFIKAMSPNFKWKRVSNFAHQKKLPRLQNIYFDYNWHQQSNGASWY